MTLINYHRKHQQFLINIMKNYREKKSERKRLNAYTCKDCEKYYSTVSEERIQISSRHRGNKRPSTPEHFWDLDFPDDIEIPTETYTFKPLEENKYYTQAKQ
ncbi:uncharacterized protein NPIL_102741 [Nephila pilipes]|uniref:DNA endonuclease activator Ctp1 C-terminal domain-containing protein n=1 Tax=Nephila pilipes TaxID=299642 RepID=A0A8X6R267_NEPPI|nr:uncharacterized protein NPIL_102741 [Nephila pilipes]